MVDGISRLGWLIAYDICSISFTTFDLLNRCAFGPLVLVKTSASALTAVVVDVRPSRHFQTNGGVHTASNNEHE